ncbi:sterol desaturase family protein [Mycobacterium sp.]|uniref:sterol desaturase family protein n=1 Tax=Mycobacterium sp. TaxID=1785 RepID=UPI003D0F99D0
MNGASAREGDSAAPVGHRSRVIEALGGPGKTALIAALVTVGIVVDYRPAAGLLIGLAVLVPVERRWRRHPFGMTRPGLGTDILHFLFSNTLKTGAIIAAAALCWVLLHPIALAPLTHALHRLPGWADAAVTFAAFNVTYYWEHRLAHHWTFLWRFHSVHHSSQRLDWLAATRLHPLEGFFGGFVVTAPLVLAGFGPTQLGIAGIIFAINDVLIHANVRWRLRRLSHWIPTPEYHHWHHANEPGVLNKNFGWPILDRVFGTFYLPADRRPTTYGINTPTSEGYFAQLAEPMRPSWPLTRAQHDAAG